MELISLLGIGCVFYVVAEVSLAARRCRRWARFEAVDVSTGRPIDLVVDRRRASRGGARPDLPLPR